MTDEQGQTTALSKYNTLKGIHDIFPPDVFVWNKIERTAKDLFYIFGYDEIKIPVMESTEVFTRSIGQSTDIVGKEMYTFTDKGDRSVTLRPEGTASVVRCYVENALNRRPAPQKFYYVGPMFRYERPQKGRMRQFYQIGAECFASASAEADAEILGILNEFFNKLKVPELRLEINSIGCKACRPDYNSALTRFFSQKEEFLCGDCRARLKKNPLRILDCKVESCGQLRKDAPLITDFLCENCKSHHERLRELLTSRGISFRDNPSIVRGLDYYTKTTFEITSEHLGAQNAVAAGGRYDNLVEEFGGPPTPAIGFAIGMERLAGLMKQFAPSPNTPFFYFAPLGEEALNIAISLAINLMDKNISSICTQWQMSLKGHMKRADKLNAEYVIMIGADEIQKNTAVWKHLSTGTQGEISIEDIGAFVTLHEKRLKAERS
ncbi:MAG: histidine--tRNA ligase [Nitrospirae bacterium]|nr:histidine--tRNA ligase [Nitrospirota bacterium]